MTLRVEKDSTYVLNYCTSSLARDNTDARHNYGQYDARRSAGAHRRGLALSDHRQLLRRRQPRERQRSNS